ncbi:MAG: hypothetical protein U0736_01740 [Gemmataceae bacterium]
MARHALSVLPEQQEHFKERGWSRGIAVAARRAGALPGLLGARYFGQAMHEGIAAANPAARLLFRADISRPMWQAATVSTGCSITTW